MNDTTLSDVIVGLGLAVVIFAILIALAFVRWPVRRPRRHDVRGDGDHAQSGDRGFGDGGGSGGDGGGD